MAKHHKFGKRSMRRLEGVHPDLVKVVKRALEIFPHDFTILEGIRSEKRQRELVRAGSSQTMRSRHLTGHAVDLGVMVAGRLTWKYELYQELYKYMRQAARELDIPILWGGNWKTLKDGPHYQLSWKWYPVK